MSLVGLLFLSLLSLRLDLGGSSSEPVDKSLVQCNSWEMAET